MTPNPLQKSKGAQLALITSILRQKKVIGALSEVKKAQNNALDKETLRAKEKILFDELYPAIVDAFLTQPALNCLTGAELFDRLNTCLPRSMVLSEHYLTNLCDKVIINVRRNQFKDSLPERAVLEEELIDKSDEAVAPSGHAVKKIYFSKQSRFNGSGFYKACDSTYPPLLACYAVAISQLYRLSLAGRACDDLLVYDREGNIKGTVSITIDSFKPFSHPDLKHVSTDELVKNNIAELLVSAWRHKEDDLHPGNIGLAAKIDSDMSWYNITHVIKGERLIHDFIISNPESSTRLKAEHLETFPFSIGQRTHWPTKKPENFNQGKSYVAMAEFIALKDNETFRKQMFFALLKELLSFQTDVATKQIQRYLGHEPLNLNQLDEAKKERLLHLFGKACFFDGEQEKTFAKHFIEQAEREYQEFYQVVVRYAPFRDYLLNTPRLLELQIAWFEQQKEKFPELSLNIKKIEQQFHRILKDSLESEVAISLNNLLGMINQLQKTIRINKASIESEEMELEELLPAYEKALSELPKLPQTKTKVSVGVIEAGLKETCDRLAELYESLRNLSLTYFNESKESDIHGEKYTWNFFTKFQALATQFDDSHIEQEAETWYWRIQEWKRNISLLCHKARFSQCFLHGNDMQHKEQRRYVVPKRNTKLTIFTRTTVIATPQVADTLRRAIVSWLASQDYKTIKNIVLKDALSEYRPKGRSSWLGVFNVYGWTRTRTPFIEKTEKEITAAYERDFNSCKTKEEINVLNRYAIYQLLSALLAEGGWTNSSYNYYLTQHLTRQMLQNFSGIDNRLGSFPLLNEFIESDLSSGRVVIKPELFDALSINADAWQENLQKLNDRLPAKVGKTSLEL